MPNLLRALVADSALSAAFVPVFTELLEQKKRKDAFQLAGALFGLILVVLGAITVLFIVIAPCVIPLITGDKFSAELDELTVGLSRVMFPIVVLLGLNGLVVGILNAYDHFAIPAIAPVVWNLVIIAALVVLKPLFEGPNEVYAYAIGVLRGTVVQFGMCLPVLRRVGFQLKISFNLRDPRIRQVLRLMLPVTIGLGLINFNLLINSILGSLVSAGGAGGDRPRVPALHAAAGRSSRVAVATVLFPTLSRLAARRDLDGLRRASGNGVRHDRAVPDPGRRRRPRCSPSRSRASSTSAASSAPASTDDGGRGAVLVLVLAAVLGREPAAHAHVLLAPAAVGPDRAGGRDAARSTPACRPRSTSRSGSPGIVIGTAVASAAMTVGQAYRLRLELHGFEIGRTLRGVARMLAASAVLGVIAYFGWEALDSALGASLLAQFVTVGSRSRSASVVYIAAVLALRIPEARQIAGIVRGRLGRRAPRNLSWPHGGPGPHPELLDHRPYRPREVDAGRSHPRDDPHGRPALDARAAAGLDGPRARARHHDQGPGGARLLRRRRTARPTSCT